MSLYFFRIRIDQVQWILTEDSRVKTGVTACRELNVKIPHEIQPDGRDSYTGRYRMWLAIGKVLANENITDGYIVNARGDFVVWEVNTTDSGLFAASVATLFNRLSSGAKTTDETDIDWENEDQVVEALVT